MSRETENSITWLAEEDENIWQPGGIDWIAATPFDGSYPCSIRQYILRFMKGESEQNEAETDLMRIARLARLLWEMDGAQPGAYKEYFDRAAGATGLGQGFEGGNQTGPVSNGLPQSGEPENHEPATITVVPVQWTQTWWEHSILRESQGPLMDKGESGIASRHWPTRTFFGRR